MEVKTIAVIGAGTMGRGIAYAFRGQTVVAEIGRASCRERVCSTV